MRTKGVFICSTVEYEQTIYIRLLTTYSWEEYKDNLETWYPDYKWNQEDHRVWFNLPNIYKSIEDKLKEVIESLQSSKMNFVLGNATSNGCYYSCTNSSGVSMDKLRTVLFPAIHQIILDELENDMSDDKDFIDELREHSYQGNATITFYDSADSHITQMEKDKSAGKPIYKPLDVTAITDTAFRVTCNSYSKDPWNPTHPIVWTSEALKDLIKYCQYAGIVIGLDGDLAKHKCVKDFWLVDDTLNVRSKSTTEMLSKYDIRYMFSLLGDVPSFMYSTLNQKTDEYSEASMCLDDYYTLPSISKDKQVILYPCGLYSTLPHGKLFGHSVAVFGTDASFDKKSGKIISKILPDLGTVANTFTQTQDVAKKEANEKVYTVKLLSNAISQKIKCDNEWPLDTLLPEITVLNCIELKNKQDASAIICEFNNRFNVNPSPYEKYISLFLRDAYGVKVSKLEKTSEFYTILPMENELENLFSVQETCTVRSALEFLLKRFKLIPSTQWTPSSVVLDQLYQYITVLQNSHTVFANLTCQKNQLSVILADIVPKKRFVSGQMFQMQPPTAYIIDNAITELKKIYVKKSSIPSLIAFVPPLPKNTKNKSVSYQDIRSDINVKKEEPSPWCISTIDKPAENNNKLDLDIK
jgi:hypothetical protein